MGRHYRAEDGTKRGPMDSRWDLDLFWEKGQTGPKEPGWNRDGSVNDRYPNPHGALIAEWQDLTQITTSFGLLDEETQKALKAHEGGIEYYCSDGTWIVLGFPIWDKGKTYRAKPEPKRETFTGECRAMVFQRRCPTLTDEGTQGQPGKYTAEVVDGDITRIVWEASE
ncbi:hypothetical protein [Ruegeria sp. HKCCD6109]|uniref:hypothetical protein n=1 Tax=Ruegeria sp. HKCCD6109 TaxID=2683017 RepID=UPI001491DF20|nr:hypothetical protein [Ruegeria sp. HKCCD6109]NOD65785.1 hypothetical protein [Ruegeria sp. HKCCD6109]